MDTPKTYQNALKAFNNENYKESIFILDDLITKERFKAEYYYSRARSYYFSKNYKMALIDIDKAIELNPDFEFYYNIRESVYRALGNLEKAKENAHPKFIILDNKRQSYYRGRNYFKEGNFVLAEKCLSFAVKVYLINPTETFVLLGYARLQIGDYTGAYSAFIASENYNPPNRAVIHAGISKSLLEISKKDSNIAGDKDAIQSAKSNIKSSLYHLHKALKLEPENVELQKLKNDCKDHYFTIYPSEKF